MELIREIANYPGFIIAVIAWIFLILALILKRRSKSKSRREEVR